VDLGSMRAIVRERYGGPEALRAVQRPVPTAGEGRVLVRIAASSVNPVDWHDLRGEPFPVRVVGGLRRPKDERMGTDLAGVVAAVGAGVADLEVGDRVLGVGPGAWAEATVTRASNLVRCPDGIDLVGAAGVPVAATTALQALRSGGPPAAGSRVLIVGASGGVGSFAVQLARANGLQVTALTGPSTLDLVASLGADRVLDRTRTDAIRAADRYDRIIDLSGTRPIRHWLGRLAPGGTFVVVGAPGGRWLRPVDRMLAARMLTVLRRGRAVSFIAAVGRDSLQELADLLAAGHIRTVIDRTLPMSRIVDAVRHQESGRAHGKVLLTG
jgi:NADPH:quinone reductase-like Zn-dependent oxidoreductase